MPDTDEADLSEFLGGTPTVTPVSTVSIEEDDSESLSDFFEGSKSHG